MFQENHQIYSPDTNPDSPKASPGPISLLSKARGRCSQALRRAVGHQSATALQGRLHLLPRLQQKTPILEEEIPASYGALVKT